MKLYQFIINNTGKGLDFDGAYGNQCVDLVQFYNRDVLGNSQPFTGNAIDIYGQQADKFDWVENTPAGVPAPGDIVVWKANTANTGAAGHINVAYQPNDTQAYFGFDQNFNDHPYCEIIKHGYEDVLGWGHYKTPASPVQEVDVISADDVKNLYLVLLGRAASDDEANSWAGQSWHDVYYGVKDSPEGQAHGKALADQVTSLEAQIDNLTKNPPVNPNVPIPVTTTVYKDRPVPADPSTLTIAQLWNELWRKLIGK